MQELTYTSICRNNGLIIFDALSETELQTGRRLHEDLIDYCREIDRQGYCTHYSIKSKQMLIAVLQLVLSECRAGVLCPVLHFECHGDPEKGLYIHASKEYVGWSELVQHLAEINQATRNNVGVVLAACYGFEISKFITFTIPCPFNFVIAPQDVIQAGRLQDVVLDFYKTTVKSGDLQGGLVALDNQLVLFHCGEWFFSTLASCMITNFNAVARSQMVELMVSNEVAKVGYRNRELLREQRAKAKKFLKSPQNFYRLMSRTFLHNKIPISYEDFHAFVEGKRPR
ncbi:hypothetical protein BK666_20015 [Pseudomonas frederiksbergensis]|uniref:Uncharacterized protein n=1 Tax=Pseudomonas frederiksbergensis TaxID=104087 RepID=A0A423JZE8_9PSED|nr:hypothetical protein [Pseudomonas frederiksbergensis]RON43373.1 hypothetical protein BK666_20015 [Pseudomonas frederiksbergensis]